MPPTPQPDEHSGSVAARPTPVYTADLPRISRPPDHQRRELVRRAQAALPEDATDKQIAAKAIDLAHAERGGSWVDLVDAGWTFSAADVATLLGRTPG